MEVVHPQGKLFDEGLLAEIRDRFCHVTSDPFSGPRIYLENAGGGLTLKRVVDLVAEQTALPDNAGRDNPTSKHIGQLLAQGKADLATLFGATAGTVAMGESTTTNAFRVLDAIMRTTPGDNVVTTNLDHPAVYDSTRLLCERYDKQWRIAPLCGKTGRVTVEALTEQVDAGTIALAMIHGSNILGTVNDAAALIAAARQIKPDLHVMLDGAQHGSHAPVDVEALGCDVYHLSSYKLFSKVGASVAYLSPRVAALPRDQLIGKPQLDWDMGTREQGAYAAWSAVKDYLCWLGGHFTEADADRALVVAGLSAINLHERALLHLVLHGAEGVRGLLALPGVDVYGEVDDLTVREAVVAINVAGMTSQQVVSLLGERGIRVHVRLFDAYSKHTLEAFGIRECVRVSFGHYSSPAEATAFLTAVGEAVR